MKRLALSMAMIGAFLLVSSMANAAYWWEAKYDLSQGTSTVNIYDPAMPPPNPPLLVFPHPMAGTLTVYWGAATEFAPITQGRLIGGNSSVDQYADAGVFILTGVANTVFLPGAFGTPGLISGSDFTLNVVNDSAATGYLHCTVGNCPLGGFATSVPSPLTPTGPGPFPITIPKWTSTGTDVANDPNWTSSLDIQTIPANPPATPFLNVIETQYVGQEISRIPVPEPSFAAMLLPGLGLLGAMGWFRQRR